MTLENRVVELDRADLERKLDQIEAHMGEDMAKPFRQLFAAYDALLALVQEKSISIERLRKMVFGPTSESSSAVLGPLTSTSAPTGDDSPNPPAGEPPSPKEGASGTSPPSDGDGSSPKRPKRRRRGHGRLAAQDYPGCEKVVILHDSLHPGDTCLDCAAGTLYRQVDWATLVRLKGQPPIGGTVYQRERLRCSLCGAVHTAPPPENVGTEKYDPTVASVVAVLRYGEGMPFNRIQRIQQVAGIPLPASDQWYIVRDALGCGPQVVFDHLAGVAAQGEVVHNDDTTMRVLELIKKLKRGEPLLAEDPDRRGIFTTTIVSLDTGRPKIALFFTGSRHSGENLRTLLAKRFSHLPNCIQMCDALSRNMPDDLPVITANCLAHARRKFVELAKHFPSEVAYVLTKLKRVFKTDRNARKLDLSPEDRLRLHQRRSGPVMDELQKWLREQIDQKKVEPNSSLGGAISYMLNHWEELTLFLRVPKAPLDNNLAERSLKMPIRHRNNSLFYKTVQGAAVGDVYMSLIYTCYFCDADPFDYLTQLQLNQERVKAAPGDWLPWNYRERLASSQPSDGSADSQAMTAEARSATVPES